MMVGIVLAVGYVWLANKAWGYIMAHVCYCGADKRELNGNVLRTRV